MSEAMNLKEVCVDQMILYAENRKSREKRSRFSHFIGERELEYKKLDYTDDEWT